MPIGNASEPTSMSSTLLHGAHPIIIYTSTGDESYSKDGPLLNPLSFLAKPNDSIRSSVKCLSSTPPEGQQSLLGWILLAPGLL